MLAGLLLAAVGTYLTYTSVHPSYESRASIVLIPPKVAVTVGDNPYLYLGGLDQALGVLQVKVSSPEISGELVKRYHGGLLTVARDATTTGPILSITATADDPASSLKLLQGAEDLVPSTLATLQAQLKVPADSVITSMQLSADDSPSKVSKKQVQATATVGVGGGAATLVLVGLIDRLLARRSESKPRTKEERSKVREGRGGGEHGSRVADAESGRRGQRPVDSLRERPSNRRRVGAGEQGPSASRQPGSAAHAEQRLELSPASLDDARS